MKKKTPVIKIDSRQLYDQRWRLNNLYFIVNKDGRRVRYEFNWAQELLYNNKHTHNIVLKARQLGVSTFVSLYFLDCIVFERTKHAGIVAHDLPSARGLFRDKVRYAFENLPEQIRDLRTPLNDSSDELVLNNGSSLRVATSMRSGTLNYLHISELGKISARYPERAREVISGSLNTLGPNAESWIESTAEGQEGHFFDLCQLAQSKQRIGQPLSSMEAKFFFLPWWQDPGYAGQPIPIPEEFKKYFDELQAAHDIVLTPEQKGWYVRKAETQGDDMRREFPSMADEAFAASVEGVYYGQQIARAEQEGRIGNFKAVPGAPIYTAWDIGVGDSTSIWTFQFVRDTKRLRFLNYIEHSGEGMEYYAQRVRQVCAQHNWPVIERNFFPHDVRVREWGTGQTRLEQILALKIRASVVPNHSVEDGINAVRMSFKKFEFDAAGCAEGLKAIRNYRREWNEERGCWRDKPRHDWASHGADALRYAAISWRPFMETPNDNSGSSDDPNKPDPNDLRTPVLMVSDPKTQRGVSLDELFDYAERGSRRRERRI